jgi:copper homeostasis protein
MSRPIFEVIATSVSDAVAAVAGGADRLELVTGMDAGGLTPDVSVFARIRAAVDVPLRVMLRPNAGYAVTDEELLTLCGATRNLRDEGAQEFVIGFLDAEGLPDTAALRTLLAEVPGCRWTFHRALDHSADRAEARRRLATLPGLDAVLTAGSPTGVTEGMDTLRAEAGGEGPRVLAGGGLLPQQVPALRAAGVDAFHVGSGVREGGWDAPVSVPAVKEWRALMDE